MFTNTTLWTNDPIYSAITRPGRFFDVLDFAARLVEMAAVNDTSPDSTRPTTPAPVAQAQAA